MPQDILLSSPSSGGLVYGVGPAAELQYDCSTSFLICCGPLKNGKRLCVSKRVLCQKNALNAKEKFDIDCIWRMVAQDRWLIGQQPLCHERFFRKNSEKIPGGALWLPL